MVKERLKIYLFYFIILPKFICQSSIIVFNSYQYRSGHFAFTSNGDMIVEYSYNKNRLFYGLDKNGKYYFKNSDQSKVPTKEITLSFNNNNAYRYEARNIFVTIDNKEYLFSIATHSSVVELFDLHDGNYIDISYKLRLSENFLGNKLYSYVFSLLKMDNNQYLISYFYMNNNGYYSLQKFNFINFGLENSDLQKNITSEAYEIKYANRIVSCFIMGKEIVVFLVGYENKYVLYIYDFKK